MSTIAWFRPGPPDVANPLDDLGAVILALRERHTIEVIDRRRAHDFVWMSPRGAYDVCVYELDNTPGHEFIWPYLAHFPGVVALRSTILHDSRADSLVRHQRGKDYAAEMAFNGAGCRTTTFWRAPRGTWPMLREPLLASRVVVVSDPALVENLEKEYPGARVRYAPVGVLEPDGSGGGHTASNGSDVVSFGVLDTSRAAAVQRAAHRAERMGVRMKLISNANPASVSREADVVIALRWPSSGEPLTHARLGMAAAKPVIVSETFATAAWPALDPQTWQPRDPGSDAAPIVVSVDPRDEEHSLMLAMRRLASDAELRSDLGAAARAWWQQHATVAHAARAWEEILLEASTLAPPERPADWPAHLSADGSEHAREVLRAFGASVDFLSSG